MSVKITATRCSRVTICVNMYNTNEWIIFDGDKEYSNRHTYIPKYR